LAADQGIKGPAGAASALPTEKMQGEKNALHFFCRHFFVKKHKNPAAALHERRKATKKSFTSLKSSYICNHSQQEHTD